MSESENKTNWINILISFLTVIMGGMITGFFWYVDKLESQKKAEKEYKKKLENEILELEREYKKEIQEYKELSNKRFYEYKENTNVVIQELKSDIKFLRNNDFYMVKQYRKEDEKILKEVHELKSK